jgi:hypothetical protein
MIRTQIQLTEEQQAILREISVSTGRSIAEVIRDAIDRAISSRTRPTRQEQVERAIRVAGRFSSGASDGSADHDRHLEDAFR